MNAYNSVDQLNRIKGEIFLGNASAAKNMPLLKSNSITHILICCSEIGPSFPDNFSYKKLNIKETFDFNVSTFFQEAFEFIDSAVSQGGAVLIHCVQGQSRSPTIAISYLMRRFHFSLSKSLALVKKKHPQADPNVGFLEQLKTYEKILEETNPSLTCSVCKCGIQ